MSNSAFTPTFAQNLQDASTTQSGLVNTSAQNFKGIKSFLEPYLRVSTDTTSGYGFLQLGQSSTATNNWHFGSEGNGVFNLWNGNWGAPLINALSITSAGLLTAKDLTTTGLIFAGSTKLSSSVHKLCIVASGNDCGLTLEKSTLPGAFTSIGGIDCIGYDSSTYFVGATINFRAAETWSATNHGSRIQFRATPTGSGGALVEVGSANGSGAWNQGNNSSTWSTTSDRRIKDNIRPVSNSLDKIIALNPCHYEYKTNPGKVKTGFIAQEFEQVLPGHVHLQKASEEQKPFLDGDEDVKGIDPDLIPYLVGAIKELKQQLDEAKAEIQALKNT